MSISEKPPILVNLYAEIICKELAELGIKHDTEWIPTDNLWVLWFKDHANVNKVIVFRVFGYFSPMYLVSGRCIDTEPGWVSADAVVSLIKNTYCKLPERKMK